MLSNLYAPIYVFRYDEFYQTVFILAKNSFDQEIQVVIFPNGILRFIDDDTQL
ncbi:MAG: hypothetical protein N5P05_000410 [Chroococcopsis gigantea SAG 12.99]|jgi:hypothetical protein|nr:hypothetical protein [Chroococcopsis gigantea SAG 12.99]